VRVLCLDLGSREMKILEANGTRLVGHAEVLLPDGSLTDGVPTPLLTAAVRGAVEQGGFAARQVRLAIAETGTAFGNFVLPPMPASELSSAVAFEGRRIIPMDPADVYFAWHAAREARGYAIYMVAARRDMIDPLIAAVTAAGLLVDRVDLKPLALARGVGISDGLLLEWGAAEATLLWMVRARPHFFRTFQLDAPPEDVAGQFDELSLSLNALVKFMRGGSPEVSITNSTPLFLAGRFAFLPDAIRQAEERFPFNVRQPQAPMKVPDGFPWQAHLAGLGLLRQGRWWDRLSPAQGGDNRVAA
jgi:hypothetical protein